MINCHKQGLLIGDQILTTNPREDANITKTYASNIARPNRTQFPWKIFTDERSNLCVLQFPARLHNHHQSRFTTARRYAELPGNASEANSGGPELCLARPTCRQSCGRVGLPTWQILNVWLKGWRNLDETPLPVLRQSVRFGFWPPDSYTVAHGWTAVQVQCLW